VAEEPRYSSVWRMTDGASLDGQRRHFRLLRFELSVVIVGALLSAIDDRVSRILAAIAFVLAIVMRATRISTNPVVDWHQGRAAAESVKTLCWRYAVCAAPFGREVADDEADKEFVRRLDEILGQVTSLHMIPPSDDDGEQITAWMRATRTSSLAERKETYQVQRIDDQRSWYGAKARSAGRSSQRWSVAVLLLECLGAGLAMVSLAKMTGWGGFSPGTLLGVVAAVIAAVAAWTQARQYGNIATAYTIAHQELTSIRGLLAAQGDETEWSSFVDSAEGAISREHTMWRAARTGGAA